MALIALNDANKLGDILPWQPKEALALIEPKQLRYSGGFLAAQPNLWFSELRQNWSKFADHLGKSLDVKGVQTIAELPDNLSHYYTISINSEPAVIGIKADDVSTLVGLLQDSPPALAGEIFLEYLVRRFVSSLQKSWNQKDSALNCYYVQSGRVPSLVVDGAIHIEVMLGHDLLPIWIGLSPVTVDKIDHIWKQKQAPETLDVASEGQEIVAIEVNLVELAVPPSLLIDYLRTGAVIDLAVPISSNVLLRVEGIGKVLGELVRFGENYAIKIVGEVEEEASLPPGTTRLGVEIANIKIARARFLDILKSKGCFQTAEAVTNNVSLKIGDEEVAQGVVAVLDRRFVLKVL
jgi:hypothetical protein